MYVCVCVPTYNDFHCNGIATKYDRLTYHNEQVQTPIMAIIFTFRLIPLGKV